MSKGDWAKVKSEIGGQLVVDEIKVLGAGGTLEIEYPEADKKGLAPILSMVTIKVLGRTGKVRSEIAFATSALRSVEVVRRDDE